MPVRLALAGVPVGTAMLIGIVSDIHDAVDPLRTALSLLRARGAERIVTLGDAFESHQTGGPGAQIARLLHAEDATGVWGNHDFGLSHDVPEAVRESADPALLAFASRLMPQLAIEGCRFSHIEPWRDAHLLEDLWAFDGLPETGERARLSFGAVPERIIFVGHFHTCMVVRRDGRMEWDGAGTIGLEPPERHLVLVPAVVNGWCATYETARSELTIIRCMS